MIQKVYKHLLAVVFCLCTSIAYGHQFVVDGIYYNILSNEDKTVEVTFYGNSYNSMINEYGGHEVIPANVIYGNVTYTVVAIGDNAFLMNENVTGVTLPNTIKRIGVAGLGVNEVETDFTTLRIADLRAWCDIDFFNSNPMSKAEYIYFNDELITTDLVIPNGVNKINNYVFDGFCSLENVTIPNSVSEIGNKAFSSCSNIKSIICHSTTPPVCATDAFPASIISTCKLLVPSSSLDLYKETSPWSTFENIEGFQSGTCGANIAWTLSPNGTLTISGTGEMTNYSSYTNTPWSNNLSSIKEVIIEDGVTSIGKLAFSRCSSLTSVSIPNSVTSIGDYAFEYCSSLTSMNIPNSIASIGNNAFYYCI